MTQTLRGQCPVSCANPARRLWARHCATRIVPSERNSRRVPFQSHSWRWRHPLPRRVLLASVTMLQSDRRCPTRAVLRWVGNALRGETPSATPDRRAHAIPSTLLPSFGNRTAASTLSPKKHTLKSVIAYFPREQSDSHTLRPSCRLVRRGRAHTHSSRQKTKRSLPLRATSSCVMVRHFRTIPPHAVQHFHRRREPRRILNVFFFFISAECSSCQHRVHEKHQAALQHVRRAAVCLQTRKAKKRATHVKKQKKKRSGGAGQTKRKERRQPKLKKARQPNMWQPTIRLQTQKIKT
ncbi:hypothetical protein TCDM_10545 [Trypanosoma cruzi Dm28c]|uniref:Uncharacterized protein n=1 Tax=Trypanosoma cruzi Dm28c TaxID=1416333 RepID=V5B742_TRYCR|nr:hypothetical protein TCDM_10545 [Trypanosoma cruzi Dm28c]